MALNIKDPQTEQLAREVAALTGDSLTGAVRVALVERKTRLVLARGDGDRKRRLMALLEGRVWPELPPGVRGTTLTRAEEDTVLGYGPEGA
jgi:antitoxin VapB